MENNDWLNKISIQTFAAELLTNEYSGRIEKRLDYLYDKYVRANGMELFEIIIDTLQSYQNYIDVIIERHDSEVIDEDNYPEEYRQKMYEHIREGHRNGRGFDPTIFLKLKPKTKEEIEDLRHLQLTDRYLLYGTLIKGTSGEISWYEVDSVKKKVISFRNTKKFNILSNDCGNSEFDNNKDKSSYTSTLFKNSDIEVKCINVLRLVSKDENDLVINDSNEYIKKRGHQSIILAWLDVLTEKGLINGVYETHIKINLLKNIIANLDMKENASLNGKETNTMIKYKSLFREALKKVSL